MFLLSWNDSLWWWWDSCYSFRYSTCAPFLSFYSLISSPSTNVSCSFWTHISSIAFFCTTVCRLTYRTNTCVHVAKRNTDVGIAKFHNHWPSILKALMCCRLYKHTSNNSNRVSRSATDKFNIYQRTKTHRAKVEGKDLFFLWKCIFITGYCTFVDHKKTQNYFSMPVQSFSKDSMKSILLVSWDTCALSWQCTSFFRFTSFFRLYCQWTLVMYYARHLWILNLFSSDNYCSHKLQILFWSVTSLRKAIACTKRYIVGSWT